MRSFSADGRLGGMMATLTLDDAGRLILPEAAVRVLGLKPGATTNVEITADRIEIIKGPEQETPLITEFSAEGLPIIPASVRSRLSIVDAIKSERAARDRQIARR